MARLAGGHVPPADGSVTVLPAPSGARAVVVGGTAWHVVAADVGPDWVAAQTAADPLSAPLGARFLTALADQVGSEPGCLDVVLVAPALDGVAEAAVQLQEMAVSGTSHPRVGRALTHRRDVRAWTTGEDSSLLTLGRGVAGRLEVSIEVEPSERGRGLGTAVARTARRISTEPIWAQVAPANTASLRAFLAAGYRPVGAEVLFGP